jgi:hypothetical protein
MAISVVFAALAFALPQLEGASFDERDAQARLWVACGVPVLATGVWMLASTARTDLMARAGALLVIGLATATVIDADQGAFAAAFVPLAGLFITPDSTTHRQVQRTLVVFAIVACVNVLAPWLTGLGTDLGLGPPTRAVLAIGTVSAVAVAAVSGRAKTWTARLAAGSAGVFSLLVVADLDWAQAGRAGGALPVAAVLFAVPMLAILWAAADDRLSWRDSA